MPSFLTDVFSPAGGLADLSGGSDAVFGTKPRVAPFQPIDTSAEAGKALSANLENFPDILALLEKAMPGFSDLIKQGLGASSDLLTAGEGLLSGQIPQDVADQVMRSSAFKSLQGGFGGTPIGSALTARDLGRTSLDLINQGAGLIGAGGNSAQLWTNAAEQAYAPWLVSTPFQTAVTAGNNAGEQATKQFKFNVDAAPDPAALGMFNTNVAIGQQLASIVGGFFGSKGGGSTATPVAPATYSTTGAGGSSGGGVAGGWYNLSDARLKSNLRFVRLSPLGYKIYRFCYRGFKTVFEGLLAQQVQRVNPDAVLRSPHGFLMVDYAQTDVRMRRLDAVV